jgi:hypothetical protein
VLPRWLDRGFALTPTTTGKQCRPWIEFPIDPIGSAYRAAQTAGEQLAVTPATSADKQGA